MPKTWDCFHVFKSISKGLLTRLGFCLLAYLPCIHQLRRSHLSKREGKKYFFVSDFRVLFSILWRTEYQVFTVKLKIHLDTSAGGRSPEISYLLLPIFYIWEYSTHVKLPKWSLLPRQLWDGRPVAQQQAWEFSEMLRKIHMRTGTLMGKGVIIFFTILRGPIALQGVSWGEKWEGILLGAASIPLNELTFPNSCAHIVCPCFIKLKWKVLW